MPDPIGWAVLIVGALVGSLVGGVAGFGTGIIMLPLVAWAIGIRSAVPVLTVAMLVGNLSRIWWSRGEVDRAVVVRFALGGTMFAGAWAGRRLLERMSDRVFLGIIEAMLVVMGLHSLLFPR